MNNNFNISIKEVLSEYTEKYFFYITKCRSSFSNQNVHDIRVSIRRLISLLRFIQSFCPSQYNLNLISHLKKKMRYLSPLRDIQVQIDRIAADHRFSVNISGLYFYLCREEQGMINKIRESIIFDNQDFIVANIFWLNLQLNDYFNKHKIDTNVFLCEYKKTKEQLHERLNQLDRTYEQSIHNLRLGFKKYRYFLEIIIRFFPNNSFELKKLKKLQNTMGKFQDIFVFINTINLFLRRSSIKDQIHYDELIYHFQAEKLHLIDKLYGQIEQFIYPDIESIMN